MSFTFNKVSVSIRVLCFLSKAGLKGSKDMDKHQIKEARRLVCKAKGIKKASQTEWGNMLGVSTNAASNWELGKSKINKRTELAVLYLLYKNGIPEELVTAYVPIG